jgi:hypothetical protein
MHSNVVSSCDKRLPKGPPDTIRYATGNIPEKNPPKNL